VKVEYLDERGDPCSIEAKGWYARILQHEIDHLLGQLYIDRMQTRTFSSLDNFTQFWKNRPMPDVLKEIG
jgi:peptide deformylase